MSKAATAAKWTLPVAGGALVVIVQTPPDVAKANAAKWVKEVTGYLPNWPHWVDTALTVVGVLLILAGLILWLRERRRRGGSRGSGQPAPQPTPDRPRAQGIVYGPTSRGGADEDSVFHGFGDDDIPIHDHGTENRHVRPKIFRGPKER
jgi:hypothetical protein